MLRRLSSPHRSTCGIFSLTAGRHQRRLARRTICDVARRSSVLTRRTTWTGDGIWSDCRPWCYPSTELVRRAMPPTPPTCWFQVSMGNSAGLQSVISIATCHQLTHALMRYEAWLTHHNGHVAILPGRRRLPNYRWTVAWWNYPPVNTPYTYASISHLWMASASLIMHRVSSMTHSI